MRFIVYRQWEQLPECANSLFRKGEQESLFFSRIWLENLTAHALTEQQSLLLACVVEDERFLSILPLIEPLEGDLSSLSSNFTSLYSLLISHSDQQDAILDCLAVGLSQMSAHLIHFEPIDTNDDNIIRLRQRMEYHGFQSHSYFRFYNWTHPLKGQSFDEYMADRPANLRNTITRKQHKLEREHGYDIRLFNNNSSDHSLLNKVLADYHAVYKTSWKSNEFFADFTPTLVKSCSQKGWLRLAILYVNEQPIAAQIWFVAQHKANIYRLVYDEDWKRYSPGSILTEYLMRYAIDTDKVTEIDFLTGNERYKQDWMTVRKERLGIRLAKIPEAKNNFTRALQLLKKRLSLN